MNIEIVYDSNLGTTATAAQAMGKAFMAQGHQCRVQSIGKADPVEVANADLICIGSWVKGLFIIRQHPTEGTLHFINRLGDLKGKRAVVFCTYKIAAGSTLRQMAQALEKKGAVIVGQFKYRGPQPGTSFTNFAQSLR
jgi:flavodoxin